MVSPILANIYLSELDAFVEKLKSEYDRQDSYRKPQKEYSQTLALCDILPLGWLWLIAVVFQRCDDSIDPCHTHAIQRIPVCSRCHAPL